MSGDARLNILARVRQAQIRAYIQETREGMPAQLAYPASTPASRRARLLEEFKLLGVDTFVEETAEDVGRCVRALIQGKSVLSWDPEYLPYGAGAALAGEQVYYGKDSKSDQGKAEYGLTGCESVLAETGSLAMVSGPGRPRSASLMPETHIVVIRSADIMLGMGEFFAKYKQNPILPYVVFITGPSRTADIELSLTLGVHGPGRVIAVIGP